MTEPITPTPPKKPTRRKIDWEAIELDYRAGIKTVRQIGADNGGVSHVSILKRAKKEGWTRNLQAKIQAKAEALVTKQEVTKEVTKQKALAEQQVIDANAEAIANVRIGQRKDIQRGRKVVNQLLDELELVCGVENAELLSQLGDLMRTEDEWGRDKLNDLYRRLLGLNGRVGAVKTAAEALRTVVSLEREAFGITNKDDEAAKDDPLTKLLHEIAKNNSSTIQPKP